MWCSELAFSSIIYSERPGMVASIHLINVRRDHRSIDSAATYRPPQEFTQKPWEKLLGMVRHG
jgi:hypothetical protein